MEKAYSMWRAFQERVVGPIAGLLLLGCTLLALLEIFRRYILGVSFEWQSDAVTFFILSGVYLYFAISQRHGEHLTVTLVPELLEVVGPRAKRAADIIRLIALVISLVFLVAVVWWGVPEIEDAFKYEGRTESLAFPMWPFLVVFIVGLAFMAVTVIFQIYRSVQKLRGITVLDEPTEPKDAPE